ncbi:MAG: hypothetical protein WD749_02295 [Phycisphaerales bacterium]
MTTPASRKEAVERRVWRLGYLLTGDGGHAAALVDRVVRVRPDLLALEEPKLDRLVVLHAREMPAASVASVLRGSPAGAPGAPEDPGAALLRQARAAVLALPEQPREAWVLTHLEQLDDLHMSRAMDCSKVAARNHLAAADEQMTVSLGKDLPAATDRLRAHAAALDAAPLIAAHRAGRRKRAMTKWGIIAVAAAVVVLGGAWTVLRALGLSAG